jgi:hypothetical protein
VTIPVIFAEQRAMLAFEVDPGNVEPEFFGVTAERDGDRVADGDPGRQSDVLIGAARGGHDPTATLRKQSRASRHDRVDVIGLTGNSRTKHACGDQDGYNPGPKRHEPAKDARCWNLSLPSRSSSIESARTAAGRQIGREAVATAAMAVCGAREIAADTEILTSGNPAPHLPQRGRCAIAGTALSSNPGNGWQGARPKSGPFGTRNCAAFRFVACARFSRWRRPRFIASPFASFDLQTIAVDGGQLL